MGKKLPKGDKLGIHATVEKYALELLATTIAASLTSRKEKIPILKGGRIQVHQVIHLIRTEHELGTSTEKIYLRLSSQLVEIAKMLNGWITYETRKEP